MHIRFRPEAGEELAEAAAYLTQRSPRAAEKFLVDIAGASDLLLRFPHASPLIRGGFRRALLRSFAYQLIYRVEGEVIRVYAVAHLKRRPGYWRKRMPRG